ncbi:MAG: transporter [Bradymonadaceae bacterium]
MNRTCFPTIYWMIRCVILVLVSTCCLLTLPSTATAGFVPPKDSLWGKLSYLHKRADQDYLGRHAQSFDSSVELGEVGEFRALNGDVVGGSIRSHELALTVIYSPFERWALELYAPVFRHLQYTNDVPFQTKAVGPGDPAVAMGYQLTPRHMQRMGVSIYLHGKIPTGTAYPFANEATRSTGQFDTGLETRATVDLGPNILLSGRLLGRYRFAFRDGERRSKPGNELEFGFGLGGAPLDSLWLSAGYSGLRSTGLRENFGPVQDGIRTQSQYDSAYIGAYLKIGNWLGDGAWEGLAIDLIGHYVFAGRDYPQESSLGVGLAYSR